MASRDAAELPPSRGRPCHGERCAELVAQALAEPWKADLLTASPAPCRRQTSVFWPDVFSSSQTAGGALSRCGFARVEVRTALLPPCMIKLFQRRSAQKAKEFPGSGVDPGVEVDAAPYIKGRWRCLDAVTQFDFITVVEPRYAEDDGMGSSASLQHLHLLQDQRLATDPVGLSLFSLADNLMRPGSPVGDVIRNLPSVLLDPLLVS